MNRQGFDMPADDQDQTDQLPALDEGPAGRQADVLEGTGTWVSSTAELADRVAELERSLEERDAAVADLTSLLRQKTFAITRVEKDLEQARSDLMRARGVDGRAAELEQRLGDVERERAALAAQQDEQRAAIARLEDQLSESREREQVLERELDALREALGASEQSREAVSGRLAGSEARIVELEEQLANATRETLTAIQKEEHAQLEDRLAELRNALSATREELEAATGARDALLARVERLSGELAELRTAAREADRHSTGLIERLRSAEARRRFGADMRRAAMPAPAEDPRVEALSRKLDDERAARGHAEREFSAGLGQEREARARAERALAEREQEVAAVRKKLAGVMPHGPAHRRLTRLDPGREMVFELTAPRMSIGRTPDNDLPVRESYISRRHAVIKLGPESAVIEDLGSLNGVFVNDRRVSRELLRDGDVVMLGKARFRFGTGARQA